MSQAIFGKVKQNTLRQSVWKALRQAILRGELTPGSQINQASLAEQLGVSRGPLREALGLLEEEGLVQNIPYRGTFITDLDERTIEETYSLRRVLEQFAVERAIVYGSADQVAQLRAIVERMARAHEKQDREEYYEQDLAFHHHIHCMADHEMLLQTWKAIETNVRRGIFYGNIIYQLDTTEQLTDEHRRVLEAIEARDIEAAKREIEVHIAGGGLRLIAQWRASQSETGIMRKDTDQ